MRVSRVSRKGLTSIPAGVRRALGIGEGDVLVWEVDEERGVAVVRVVKNPLRCLRGKYSDPDLVYERVEELADRLIEGVVDARDRAGRADSVRK